MYGILQRTFKAKTKSPNLLVLVECMNWSLKGWDRSLCQLLNYTHLSFSGSSESKGHQYYLRFVESCSRWEFSLYLDLYFDTDYKWLTLHRKQKRSNATLNTTYFICLSNLGRFVKLKKKSFKIFFLHKSLNELCED